MEDTKICPYCGEEIKAVAKKCRFCGQWLNEDTNKVAIKEEEAKPQDITSNEQVTPEKEAKEDYQATDTVVSNKPNKGTSSKCSDGSKKSTVYWILGIVAAVLLVGIGFLLGNKESDMSEELQQTAGQEQTAVVEEVDPKAKIQKHIEDLYADVFSSPDANCESRYLTSEFYNLYVQARDMTTDGAKEWKRKIWLKGEGWREMSAKVTEVDLTF